MLFPASVVGSLPRPQFVRDLLEQQDTLPPEEYRKRMDAAVMFAIAMQEAAGLDIVSDGEWRRRSYIGVIADLCDGFERGVRDGLSWHTVVRPITVKRPGVIAEEVKFLKAHTSRMVKVCLPSPYLLGQRMWEADKSRAAYPTREAFMRALVPVLRDALRAVHDAGADVAQFDDPHLCLFVDKRVQEQYDDWRREAHLCVDLLNEIVEGISGVKIAVHLCRRNKGRSGWVGEGGYEPILPFLCALKVQQYVMEFSIPVAGDFAALRGLPEDREIGLGCVDVRSEHIDTPDEIAARVENALKYIAPDRITLNPDCGFAPGSAAEIPLDEAYVKLKNEAEAAKRLREKFASQ
ncbi:MAG: cobalamin-independent methionine synthase II family protein [Abditibacteriales bacterium]|nr:cobalamin-independent methionine synthase II family protein [Abditibacteriales bacterium]MDW8366851.1 cobalamin-independent methionine synthase II family protein [Abditibacteriales bacterium]